MESQRTKIICTVGPATEDDDVLREMMRAGMSVARLNFSHGDHAYHRANIERVRRIADELGHNVAVMVDTKGPEIRTTLNEGHEAIVVHMGEEVLLTTRPVMTAPGCIAIDYSALPNEVGPGSAIFVDDGLVELRVEEIVSATDIRCTSMNDGRVGERKGIIIPNAVLSLPAVTERDRTDIRFACEEGADAVAISFVRDAGAVREVRALCREFGRPDMMLIAKIESSLALHDLDAIVDASDGIMVARGDLGVEIPPARVPNVQKDIIAACNAAYKPVITATQMLESMTHNPRPTRAEVTDVANAIYDGTDCVMLSGETAAGEYPVEAVRMMSAVCRQVEGRLPARQGYKDRRGSDTVSIVASSGAVEMALRVGARALVCPSNTGRTARIVAAYRPSLPVILTSPYSDAIRHSCFVWGVTGVLTPLQDGLDRICYNALKVARRSGCVQKDDVVVITAGDPITSPLTEGSETSTNVCMIAQVF